MRKAKLNDCTKVQLDNNARVDHFGANYPQNKGLSEILISLSRRVYPAWQGSKEQLPARDCTKEVRPM